MLARLMTFNDREFVDPEDPRVVLLRKTVKETPGFIAGYELVSDDHRRVFTLILAEDGDTHAEIGRRLSQRADRDKLGVDPDEAEMLRAFPF